MCIRDSATPAESVELHANGSPTMQYGNGHDALQDNNWHHIVAVVDGSDNKFYVDGSAVATTFRAGTAGSTGPIWDNGGQVIGSLGDGSYSLEGQVAIVRIYTGSFSSTDVSGNYNAEKSRFGH